MLQIFNFLWYSIYFYLTQQFYYAFSFYFLLFLTSFSQFLIIETVRLKLALSIPRGNPITVANDGIEMLPVVTDKTINNLSK